MQHLPRHTILHAATAVRDLCVMSATRPRGRLGEKGDINAWFIYCAIQSALRLRRRVTYDLLKASLTTRHCVYMTDILVALRVCVLLGMQDAAA